MWRRIINLDVGEQVRIGEALVTLEYKSGRRARLNIEADNDIRIEHIKSAAAAPVSPKAKTIFNALDNATVIG